MARAVVEQVEARWRRRRRRRARSRTRRGRRGGRPGRPRAPRSADERPAVDQRAHAVGVEPAAGGDAVDDLAEVGVEQRVERLARRRRVGALGEGLGGALEAPGGEEARLDLELVEGAAQEEAVGVEAEQRDLAGRSQRERRAGRGEEVLERAVAALAGRLEVAVDPLAGGGEGLDLAAQLLGLGEAEGGVADLEREPDDARRRRARRRAPSRGRTGSAPGPSPGSVKGRSGPWSGRSPSMR